MAKKREERKGVSRRKDEAADPVAEVSYVVAIGASAGGLEALEGFFRRMPSSTGMAFVLIPHLAPSRKSLMVEILQKDTDMKVAEVESGMKIEPDRVYIIPPNRNMMLANDAFHLVRPEETAGVRHPIDIFLRSLAEAVGEKAICIILSGTGTEGAQGLRAIKESGGLVVVQDPESAKYDGMPRSAIATGIVDWVAPVDEIPGYLLKYAKGVKRSGKKVPLGKQSDSLKTIFSLIRAQTKHDFSQYKPTTIQRRIERRMAVHQIGSVSGYARYLQHNPAEVNLLFKELLIRVTSFFRDPAAFEAIRRAVLPELFKGRRSGEPVRVWVPGCSTGEEAYSLALLFSGFLAEMKLDSPVQIFATDVDDDAIETARRGTYPLSIDVDVPKDLLRRYFRKNDDRYILKKEIRDMVVFAVQNVTTDPPFSRIDLISCRNLMIYLDSQLQKRLTPLFHYSLRPEGFLFLGTSETIGEFSDLFTVVDRKWKIFKPKNVPSPRPMGLDLSAPHFAGGKGRREGQEGEERKGHPRPEALTLGIFAERLLLEDYVPACLVVNTKGDILYIHGRTGKYLEPAPGAARMNVFDMAREGLGSALRAAWHRVSTRRQDVHLEGLEVKENGDVRTVNLRVRHITEPEAFQGLMVLIFQDATPAPREKGKGSMPRRQGKPEERIRELEFEVKSAKEQLRTTTEELEASNEELQSTNEELQSANEELQSMNEELETSKEELQSMNEELTTVNAELQTKVEELTQTNNDMNNLLTSTRIATIFLDHDLRIKRFTPESTRMINLIPGDIGRPLSDISSHLSYDVKNIANDGREVLKTLVPKEYEVEDLSGGWYVMRILPYRTIDNVIDGLVITFSEITAQKKLQTSLRKSFDFMEGIVETVREPLVVLDHELCVLTANESFYETFQVLPKETEGRRIYELGNKQWDIPALRDALGKILPERLRLEDFEVEHDFPGIGPRKMLLNARQIRTGDDKPQILLAVEDITDNRGR